jgi:hypothetical protein
MSEDPPAHGSCGAAREEEKDKENGIDKGTRTITRRRTMVGRRGRGRQTRAAKRMMGSDGDFAIG